MKTLFAGAVALLSTASFASTWDIDSAHASAGFTARHMMISNVNGRMGDVKGTVELDDKDITKSKIDVSIDVTGIDTKMAKRDGHLKSPDFFDAEKFPTATFKSTKIEKAGDKLKITGDLTIKGTTKAVTLDAEVTPEAQGMKGPIRGVSATTVINRDDFGLTGGAGPLSANGAVLAKEVKIAIDLELNKKEAAAPAKKK